MATMMKCGHAANAVRSTDQAPVCVICMGLTPDAEIPDTKPDLTGRMATCSYGGHRSVPSSTNLAFFSHRSNMDTDEYYCGCHGWD